MPRKVTVTKDIIINGAVELIRSKGLENFNARALAKEIGCSTQPIFSTFKNMEELKAEVIKYATQIYNEYIKKAKESKKEFAKYKEVGLAYLKLAKNEPELFKLLFFRDRQNEDQQNMEDSNMEYILQSIMDKTGLSKQDAYTFHLYMWIFTQGLASMLITHYLELDDKSIDELLTKQFLIMKSGFKNLEK